MGGSHKGSGFERDISTKLSLWWSNCERDDIFWRVLGSGGRATNRSRRGKQTFGSYGDIQASDPIGQPLLDLCTFELKVGYKKWSIMDAFDKSPKMKNQTFEDFMEQVCLSSKNAGTPYPVLITKRDQRIPLIFYPRSFHFKLEELCGKLGVKDMKSGVMRFCWMEEPYIMLRLIDWLKWVSVEAILELHKEYKASKEEPKRIVRRVVK